MQSLTPQIKAVATFETFFRSSLYGLICGSTTVFQSITSESIDYIRNLNVQFIIYIMYRAIN